MRKIDVEVSVPLIDCAHQGCGSHAIARVRAPTGWANLCLYHYEHQLDGEAREYCLAHGLNTTEKKIAHCRELFGSIRRRERMPGEDDDLPMPSLAVEM